MRSLTAILLWSIASAVQQEDHYEVLGVSRKADASTIKRAYYKLAKTSHPDKVTDPSLRANAEKKFKRIAEAHSTLVDATSRREYDAMLLNEAKRQYFQQRDDKLAQQRPV